MIESISIENYKSIRALPDFKLKPVNILIGANNSGKSNFLDVFSFLRDLTLYNDPEGYQQSGWRWPIEKRGGWKSICFLEALFFRISIDADDFKYAVEFHRDPSYANSYQLDMERLSSVDGLKNFFELLDHKIEYYDDKGSTIGSSDSNITSGLSQSSSQRGLYLPVVEFVQEISKIKIYDRIHTEKWSLIRTPQKPKSETILNEDGSNLVSVLAQLSQLHEKFPLELNSLLKILYPDFSRISFPSNDRGELMIRWEDAHGRVAHTPQLSDGTLKFLCMIAILKNPSPPPLIGIDEPDAKLHPRMQGIFADMIREAGERAQIIATTHNPDFVSLFKPEQIVIMQQYRGETEMRRLSNKGALDMWLKDFTIRKLWLMGELETRW